MQLWSCIVGAPKILYHGNDDDVALFMAHSVYTPCTVHAEPSVISSYLCSDAGELHENSHNYKGGRPIGRCVTFATAVDLAVAVPLRPL